jgi:hypothetical protein
MTSNRRSFLREAAGAGVLATFSPLALRRFLHAEPQDSQTDANAPSSNDPIMVWLKEHATGPSARTAGSSTAARFSLASRTFIKTAGPFYDKMKATSNIPSNYKDMGSAVQNFSDALGSFKAPITYNFLVHPHTPQPTTKLVTTMTHRMHVMGYSSLSADDFENKFRAADLDKGGKAISSQGLGTAFYKGAEAIRNGWEQHESKNSRLRGAHLVYVSWLGELGVYLTNIGQGLLAASATVGLAGAVLSLDPVTLPLGMAVLDASANLGIGGLIFWGYGTLLIDLGG